MATVNLSAVITPSNVVTQGGALGTPSSGTLTSTTGLPLTTGVTGTLPAANGGTGVANNAASTLAISGNFATTLTVSAATGVTLPTTGTLATLAGSETFTNKTLTSPAITTSITTASTSFTALAGATTLLTLGGTGASSVLAIPGTLEQSSTTGALTVAGGVYIAKKLNVVGTATFSGSASAASAKIFAVLEGATISATAATGTINYDVTTQAVLYYTTNASANWTVNFRGSSGTSLNTLMATGESVTVVFLVTQGATAYYNSAVQVDTVSVTPKWQGGTAPTSGNASSTDSYVYTIVKTGNAAFTIFAAQTKFA